MKKDTIKVGIIGFGTVGSGTAKILLQNGELIRNRTGVNIQLNKIVDLDIKRDRGFKVPDGVLSTNVGDILENDEIDIVVELIGGINPAKTFIIKALQGGKHVVTANKALLATEGKEIFYSAYANKVDIGFEASVAGGIPIIKALREGLVANNINSIYGIINGTCNYILTKMTDERAEFADVLKEAQRLGYAEADPTFDIEGIDTAHKLTILSSLAYGIPLCYDKIYREGITHITAQDIDFAKELGYKIKLLAITKRTATSKGIEIEMRVHPTMVPEHYLISKIDGVFNAVYVEGDSVGATLYYGRGAGDMPTGSAVVSDIVDIALRITSDAPALSYYNNFALTDMPLTLKNMGDIESNYYFRFSAIDKPGVLSKISGILGENDISISAVIQKGRRVGQSVPLVVLTHKSYEKNVQKAIKEIDALSVVSEKPLLIRVEDN
ncbi:MAG: homoserine dehydrogenase [Thermodesulfovibrionales bacterium]|nr:homoserine dehydrogenase [Thermodesulfovibrionales bacterium]